MHMNPDARFATGAALLLAVMYGLTAAVSN